MTQEEEIAYVLAAVVIDLVDTFDPTNLDRRLRDFARKTRGSARLLSMYPKIHDILIDLAKRIESTQ